MSKNIEIQEEFENLILELERLKTINEITTENSDNAKKTINEIQSFIQSVNIFKTSIEEDYQSKKQDLEKIESSLKLSLNTLNSNVAEQAQKFETITGEFTLKSNDNLISVNDNFNRKIDAYTSEIKSIRRKLDADVALFNEKMAAEVNVTSTNLNNNLATVNKLLKDRIDSITLELNSMMERLNDDVELFTEKISVELKERLESLNVLLDENHKSYLEQFKILNNELILNKNLSKKLFTYNIYCLVGAVVVLGLFIYILI